MESNREKHTLNGKNNATYNVLKRITQKLHER